MFRLWNWKAPFGPPAGLGLIAALICAGCSSKYAGIYEGRDPRPDAPANMAETIAKIRLELRASGHFVYIRMGFPWEGEWSEDSGRVKLIIDSAMNKDANPLAGAGPRVPILEPQEDGSMIVHDEFTGSKGVVLKRVGK